MKRLKGIRKPAARLSHSHLEGRERFYFATGILDSTGRPLPGRDRLVDPESLQRIQKKLHDCAICRKISADSFPGAGPSASASSDMDREPDLHIFYRALERSGHPDRPGRKGAVDRFRIGFHSISFPRLFREFSRTESGLFGGLVLGVVLLFLGFQLWNRDGAALHFPGGGDLTFFHQNTVLKTGDSIQTTDEAARIVIQRNHRRLGVIHLDPESRIIYRRGHGKNRPTLELVDGAAEVLIQEDTRPGSLSIQSGNIRTEFRWPPEGTAASRKDRDRSIAGKIGKGPREVHFRMEADPSEGPVTQAPEKDSVIGVEVYEGNVNVVNAESSRKLYSINKGESIQLTVDDGDISSVDRN